jgi:hypothetical protein
VSICEHWFAALAVVLLPACGDPDLVIHGDVRFTAEERAEIVRGEAWLAEQAGNEPFGVVFDLDEPRDHARSVVRGAHPSSDATGMCASNTDGDGFTIYLRTEGQPREWIAGLMAHEMAHCRYGFVDAYRPGDVPTDGIMRVLDPMRWTEAEEAQCLATNCRAAGR